MGEKTGISWTDHTFNPWWGCTKVSPACDHCYAHRDGTRFGYADHWRKKGPRRFFGPKHWSEPMAWDRKAGKEGVRRRMFCASMCDIFEDREDLVSERERLWSLLRSTYHLDKLLLTKRAENVASMVPKEWMAGHWPEDVWVGITAENQEWYDKRSHHLWNLPPNVNLFVSVEPQLGSITLFGLHRFRWVIAGGESGPQARPVHPDWIRGLRDQCQRESALFHFKQWGEWKPVHEAAFYDITKMVGFERVGTKAAGRELDGRVWDEVPGREKGAA